MSEPDLTEYGGARGAEAELRARLGEHDFLVDLFQMGEQMQAFIETTVGAFLYADLRQQFNAALAQLLDPPDNATVDRSLADLRAAWGALGRIEQALKAGREADRMMSEMDQK